MHPAAVGAKEGGFRQILPAQPLQETACPLYKIRKALAALQGHIFVRITHEVHHDFRIFQGAAPGQSSDLYFPQPSVDYKGVPALTCYDLTCPDRPDKGTGIDFVKSQAMTDRDSFMRFMRLTDTFRR